MPLLPSSPTVLYHCPCYNPSSSSSRTSATAPFSTPHHHHHPPPPTLSKPSLYSHQPLESLYFCDECEQLRCNRCVTIDISSYFCPNCLFEVPAASVKAEKNRCARNCFLCPSCTHTLSVVATDPPQDPDPASTSASLGEPPYYLSCSFCKWDSKAVGLTFDKPTGLSLQLQRREDNSPDVLELERLKDHFDPFIRSQTQALTTSNSGLPSSSSSIAPPGSDNNLVNATDSANRKAGRGSQATLAASAAALKSSKLLKDIPSLAGSRYLSGVSSASRSNAAAKEVKEEIRPYQALTSWDSGRTEGDQKGILARREDFRKDYLLHFQGADEKISGLRQRWTSPWDQPVRTSDVKPIRVPLKSKQSKRCPACRHIIIKPDIKAASNRFKIKLVAQNFLPEIRFNLAPVQPDWTSSTSQSGGRLSRRTSTLGLGGGGVSGSASSLRRRPQSVLGSVNLSSSNTNASTNIGASNVGGVDGSDSQDSESLLIPGRKYVFHSTFTNPLDDPMVVRIQVVKPGKVSGGGGEVGEGSSERAHSHVRTSSSGGGSGGALWSVIPSTTTFTVNAFNEVWELEEEEEEGGGEEGQEEGEEDEDQRDEEEAEEEEGEDGFQDVSSDQDGHRHHHHRPRVGDSVTGGGGGSGYKRSRVSIGGTSRRKRKNEGIVKRKGHHTTISFQLELAKQAKGDVEFQLLVNFTYQPEGGSGGGSGGGGGSRQSSDGPNASASTSSSGRSLSFNTSIWLGRCLEPGGGGPTSSGGTDRRTITTAMLGKRTSLLNLMGSTTTNSTIKPNVENPSSGTRADNVPEEEEEEEEVKVDLRGPSNQDKGPARVHQHVDTTTVDLPRDQGNMSTFDLT
ncbi:hypothetical protein IE53DRAFT_412453 [Violaceomyces palustris]|uniref:Uncharacterized protein n=1 Tax=Violaceomyces palustris TaxID=1673888 RepID=A0ACD0NR20_9BASI|nr:hypothetical protein IE53DRAFT_412453 [Violaceomyces palustris]